MFRGGPNLRIEVAMHDPLGVAQAQAGSLHNGPDRRSGRCRIERLAPVRGRAVGCHGPGRQRTGRGPTPCNEPPAADIPYGRADYGQFRCAHVIKGACGQIDERLRA